MPFNVGFDPVSLISGIAGMQANQQALQLERENLQFQKDQAKKQFDLATGKRTDAYGNTVGWNPITKEWETKLTDTQRGLVSAGEREQGLTLGEDAGRSRDVRRRQAERAGGAKDDFNTALMGYRYDQPDSEEASFSTIARLMAGANESRSKEVRNTLGRGALRLGRGGDIDQIVKSSNDMLGQMLPDTLLAARAQARGEHQQDVAAHNAEYLPQLNYFQGVEDDVGGTQPLFSSAPQTQANTQNAMLQQIAQSIAQGSAGVGNAYRGVAGATANSGFRGSGLSFSGSFGGDTAPDKPGYMTVPPGNSIFDPSTGQVLYTAPAYNKSGTGYTSSGSGSSSTAGHGTTDYDTAMAAVSRLIAENGGSY